MRTSFSRTQRSSAISHHAAPRGRGGRRLRPAPPLEDIAAPMVMERLEPRVLLTTYTVTSLADSGPGSLRDAIQQSNNNPDHDEIDFDTSQGTIALSGGPLEISGDVTIQGGVVSGNEASSVFLVDPNATVSLQGVTVTGGALGVFNSGMLTITGSRISDNSDGGIYNEAGGSLDVVSSTITRNFAHGGIANLGQLTLSDDSISENWSGVAGSFEGIGGGERNGRGDCELP
jgi:hypothetical protein